MRDKKVSIIIRCHNEEKHIGRLLTGILQQTALPHEIVIVDSGSTDATLAIASRYPVRIISIRKEDFSFGYSLNSGCMAASGNVLVNVSAHVYPVHHDWLEKLLQPLADEHAGLVYGKQRGNHASNYSEHRIFAKWFPDQSNLDQGHPFCNNANAAIRRDLWERFRYDESLTGLEDLSFAKQLLGAGYKIVYQAEAEVIHVHEETWRSVFNRYRREAIALKEILPHERFGFFDFCHMFIKNVLGDCLQAAKEGVLWKHSRSIVFFRLMQFWGTYRGYAQHGAVSRQLKVTFYYPQEGSILHRKKPEAKAERPVIDYTELESRNLEKDL